MYWVVVDVNAEEDLVVLIVRHLVHAPLQLMELPVKIIVELQVICLSQMANVLAFVMKDGQDQIARSKILIAQLRTLTVKQIAIQ